jgi:hypothetical protein
VEKTERPRRRRRLLKVLAVFLLVLVGLLGALPWLASGATGRDYLLRRVNAALAGTLQATDLELGWTGGQLLGGVELHDPAGRRVLRIEELRTEAGLLSLLTGDLDLGRVVLEGLELDVVRDEDGRINVSEALAKKEKEEERPEPQTLDDILREVEEALPSSLRVDLEVREARVRYHDPALVEPVEWSGAVELELAGPGEPTILRCRGETDRVGAVDLEVKLAGLGEARSAGRLNVRAHCELDPRLEQTLGQNLSAGLELATSPGGVTFDVEIIAERLQLSGAGEATVFDERPRLALARPLEVAWRADSRLLATGADAELPDEVLVQLTVESLDAPFDGEDPRGRAVLTVMGGEGRVRWAGRLREVAWRDWRAELSLAERVEFEVAGKLASQGQEGSLSLAGTAQDLTDWKRARVDAVAKLEDFPLDPVEELLGRDTRLIDLLGERMDLDVRTVSEGEGKHAVRLHAESAHLVVEGAGAASGRLARRGPHALRPPRDRAHGIAVDRRRLPAIRTGRGRVVRTAGERGRPQRARGPAAARDRRDRAGRGKDDDRRHRQSRRPLERSRRVRAGPVPRRADREAAGTPGPRGRLTRRRSGRAL